MLLIMPGPRIKSEFVELQIRILPLSVKYTLYFFVIGFWKKIFLGVNTPVKSKYKWKYFVSCFKVYDSKGYEYNTEKNNLFTHMQLKTNKCRTWKVFPSKTLTNILWELLFLTLNHNYMIAKLGFHRWVSIIRIS